MALLVTREKRLEGGRFLDKDECLVFIHLVLQIEWTELLVEVLKAW